MANGLANLIAKKATANAEHPVENGAEESARKSSSEAESVELPRTESDSAKPSQRPANPFGKRKDSGPADSSGRPSEQPDTSGGNAGGDSKPRLELSSLSLGAKPQHSDSDTGSMAPPALDSLDALDQSTDEGIAPREQLSHFADETPATKPTRDLPEGLTKEQLGFVDLIDGVYSVMHEPDMLGGVIRNIIIELKDNPEYMKLVAPDDVRSWVRGMRESMGLAKIKKQETKSKRSGGTGKKAKLVDLDMLNDLESLGVSIPE